jgi:hypothetical protein
LKIPQFANSRAASGKRDRIASSGHKVSQRYKSHSYLSCIIEERVEYSTNRDLYKSSNAFSIAQADALDENYYLVHRSAIPMELVGQEEQ